MPQSLIRQLSLVETFFSKNNKARIHWKRERKLPIRSREDVQ